MYQIFTLIVLVVIGIFVFAQMKKMRASATGALSAQRARLRELFSVHRQPGESDAAFVAMGTRKLLNNRQFYVGLTDRRVFMMEPAAGAAFRAYDRGSVAISANRRKWYDQGNMQTVVSEGWEVSLKLPEGECHTMRLYASSPYDSEQGLSIWPFLGQLGIRA